MVGQAGSVVFSSELRTTMSDRQCITFKLDLRCCRGCRRWMRRNLKRLDGVEQVEVREDDTMVTVCGSGFDEAEIVRVVRRRKGGSSGEVVSRIVHGAVRLHDSGAGCAGPAAAADYTVGANKPKPKPTVEQTRESEVEGDEKLKPTAEEMRERKVEGEGKPKLKPKPMAAAPVSPLPLLPSPPPTEFDGQKLQSAGSVKGETLVTERILAELEGTKIRTRVTTSQDACSCIRVEETRFIIDRHRRSSTVRAPSKW